jgi:zinc transporter 1/2/3
MSLLAVKGLSILAIIAVGLIGGAIPMRAAGRKASERFFSLGNAFAGGVFLGAGFIHLLPDGAENLSAFSDYPLAALFAASGLVILLLIDKVIFGKFNDEAGGGRAGSAGISAYVLVVILSVHSIIAGLSVGFEPKLNSTLVILAAILMHKGSAAFALAISMERHAVARSRQRRLLGLFVLMTPLGVLIGSLASTVVTGAAASPLEGIFDSVAAGTFIYVAILEVIAGEFAGGVDRWPKFCLIGAGLALMALLALWT